VDLPSFPNHWTGGAADPDGLALDADGRLYVVQFGAGLIHVLSPGGIFLSALGSGSGTVTNLAFDPLSPSDLLIYAATGLSFDDIGQGGVLIRITLDGIRGLTLIDPGR
jgi:sugar lactone lactonase YvrE